MGKDLHRFLYYLSSGAGYAVPKAYFRLRLKPMFASLSNDERETIRRRTAYYVHCQRQDLPDFDTLIRDFRFPFGKKNKHSAYFFDLYKTARYFDGSLGFNYLFGDVTQEPATPTIVKSRPIQQVSNNAVLLKLNSVRHFWFVEDPLRFTEKTDLLVSRNVVRQPWRALFLERHIDNPRCNIGKVNADGGNERWLKPRMTLQEQLRYKFVACIEGNDVATNLKWVMDSNSLAVMPKPKYETWFMEGSLRAGEHYVEVKPDYSDLDQQMDYYMSHPEEAERIIGNAKRHVAQFKNRRMERLIQLNVLNEYFRLTGQTNQSLL